MKKTNIFGLLVSKLIKKVRMQSVRSSEIHPTSVINSGSNVVNVSMGRYSYCGYDCTIVNAEIGSFCSIAGDVVIGGGEHPLHFVSTSPVFLSHKDSVKAKFASFNYLPTKITKIGSDVWIGSGALIKGGVTIGTGSVVGMGSVVTKDVLPYSIVVGNPARVIKRRFSDQVCDALLKSEWWNMAEKELINAGKFFNDPESLIKMLEEL